MLMIKMPSGRVGRAYLYLCFEVALEVLRSILAWFEKTAVSMIACELFHRVPRCAGKKHCVRAVTLQERDSTFVVVNAAPFANDSVRETLAVNPEHLIRHLPPRFLQYLLSADFSCFEFVACIYEQLKISKPRRVVVFEVSSAAAVAIYVHTQRIKRLQNSTQSV